MLCCGLHVTIALPAAVWKGLQTEERSLKPDQKPKQWIRKGPTSCLLGLGFTQNSLTMRIGTCIRALLIFFFCFFLFCFFRFVSHLDSSQSRFMQFISMFTDSNHKISKVRAITWKLSVSKLMTVNTKSSLFLFVLSIGIIWDLDYYVNISHLTVFCFASGFHKATLFNRVICLR